jgi:hypothetical protein
LIGKDRAIVKRERVGDEFVIWDFLGKSGINTNLYLWEGFENTNFKFENSDKNNDYVVVTGHFKEVFLINNENIKKIEFKEKDSSIDFFISINEKRVEKWLKKNTLSITQESLNIKNIDKIKEEFISGY